MRAEQGRLGGSRLRRVLADGGESIPVWAPLAALCLASATLLVVLGTRLTFFNDEWHILFQRQGFSADSILEPHNEHLSAIPILVFKALIALFGLESQLPYRLALAVVVVSLGVLVFWFVRQRAGNLLALAAAALVLFLGTAWEDLLWSFQIGLIGSLATGVGVLIALERDTPRRNAIACALLVFSILLSDLGIPFVIAATVAVLLRRRPRQLWVPGAATAVFAAWWIGWGHEAETEVTFGNIARAPTYVLDSLASGLTSIFGLARYSAGTLETYQWGRPLVALVAIALVVWAVRGGRPSRQAIVVASAALSFWILAGINFTEGREATASRYQLIDATLLILLAAELLRPVRLHPAALAAVAVLALVAIAANLGALKSGYDFLRGDAAIAKADLGALEIVGPRAPGDYQLVEPVAHTPYLTGVTAEAYFEETAEHGTPAYTVAEIEASPAEVRQAADNVMLAGYEVGLETTTRGRDRAGCRRIEGAFGGGAVEVVVPAGGATVTNLGGPELALHLRRFAPVELPVGVGKLAAGFSGRIELPRDELGLPWRLVATGGSPLEVCP